MEPVFAVEQKNNGERTVERSLMLPYIRALAQHCVQYRVLAAVISCECERSANYTRASMGKSRLSNALLHIH